MHEIDKVNHSVCRYENGRLGGCASLQLWTEQQMRTLALLILDTAEVLDRQARDFDPCNQTWP